LSYESLVRAIELIGVAVEANKRAFEWGRAAAHDLEAVKRVAMPDQSAQVIELRRAATSLEDIVAKRVEFLTGYQNAAYAKRYADLVERVRRVESDRLHGAAKLAEAVARYYFKLLAYKDEYEVARLQSDPAFRARLAAQFEGVDGKDFKLNFHLAPPLIAKRDPQTGVAKKMRFGPWMMGAFALLARLKGLRGTAFDIFGRTPERRTERALIGEYEALVDELLAKLTAENHALAIQLASLPEEIRGFGHVKERNLAAVRVKWDDLVARLRGQQSAQVIKMPVKAA
jgi:indolepyruvate ferredoxin oxidoreductase